jgi:lysophospholipase L1-like esterase
MIAPVTTVHRWMATMLSLEVLLGCRHAPAPAGSSTGDAAAFVPDRGLPAQPAAVTAPPDEARAAPAPTATVHFLGRFDTRDPAGPRFAWPGSAIVARFTGTGIAVRLHDRGKNYFNVVVDGGAPRAVATSRAAGAYTLASGLGPGEHTVVLTKRTESHVGVVQFLGLVPTGGALLPSPEPFARRIEYVGDSISCGYGDLAPAASWHFSDSTEDETIAYDSLAAAELDAQQTVVASSGVGLLRDSGGSTVNQMPVLFERTLADDPTSAWTFAAPPPDVVVIALGTNDFAAGDPGTAFQRAYVAFVGRVRAHYPSAQIVCANGPMLREPAHGRARGYIQGAVSDLVAAGDRKVSYLEFEPQQDADGYGCDYHPSPATHRKMARTLVEAIRARTGW